MRRSGRYVAISVATITLALLTGCVSSAQSVEQISAAEAITINSTEQPTKQRVIALANGSAEIIASLGFTSILIGRDIASTEKELREVPIVTSGHQVVAEKIISLRPDLVIVDRSTGPAAALDVLKRSGITVVQTPEAWTLTDIAPKVNAIAEAIGATQSGLQLNQALESSLAKFREQPSKARIIFLYLRGGSSIYLIGGKGSGADSLIKAIGAEDLGAAKLATPYSAMTSELLVSLNPDVIMVMSKGLESVGGISGLVELPGIAQTAAGRNKAIIAVDDSLLLSFGARTPDLLLKLSRAVSRTIA
jgi:iron complex transport system substrate-binding protein